MNTTTHPTGKTALTQAILPVRKAISAWLAKHDDAITAGMVVVVLILDLLGRL